MKDLQSAMAQRNRIPTFLRLGALAPIVALAVLAVFFSPWQASGVEAASPSHYNVATASNDGTKDNYLVQPIDRSNADSVSETVGDKVRTEDCAKPRTTICVAWDIVVQDGQELQIWVFETREKPDLKYVSYLSSRKKTVTITDRTARSHVIDGLTPNRWYVLEFHIVRPPNSLIGMPRLLLHQTQSDPALNPPPVCISRLDRDHPGLLSSDGKPGLALSCNPVGTLQGGRSLERWEVEVSSADGWENYLYTQYAAGNVDFTPMPYLREEMTYFVRYQLVYSDGEGLEYSPAHVETLDLGQGRLPCHDCAAQPGTAVSVTDIGGYSAIIRWDDYSPDVATYKIQYQPADGSGEEITAWHDGSELEVSFLTPGTTYNVSVTPQKDGKSIGPTLSTEFTTDAVDDVTLSITGSGVVGEGQSATFTVTANPAPASNLTAGISYEKPGAPAGRQSFTIGASGTAEVSVPTVDDAEFIPAGYVVATLVDTVPGYVPSATAGQASIAVKDNDAPTGQITITRTDVFTKAALVTWSEPSDYSPAGYVFNVFGGGAPAGGPGIQRNQEVLTGLTPGAVYNLTVLPYFNTEVVYRELAQTKTINLPTTANDFEWKGGLVKSLIARMDEVRSSDQSRHEQLTWIFNAIVDTPGTADWYTAAQCRAMAQTLGPDTVTQWKPWCDEIERREQWLSYTAPASLVADIRGYLKETGFGEDHLTRWKRALMGLGVENYNGLTAMTSDEAENLAKQGWNRWDPVAAELKKAETAEARRSSQRRVPHSGPRPEVSVDGAGNESEGGNIVFVVTADPAPSAAMTVNVGVSATGNYGVVTGTRKAAIGTTGYGTVTVETTDDNVDEPDGTVTATLLTGAGYFVSSAGSTHTLRVIDDDKPVVSIAGGSAINEGGTAEFTLTADPTPHTDLAVTVNVSQNGDYGVVTGPKTVTIGTNGTATLTIRTVDDGADEADGAVKAAVAGGEGYVASATANTAEVSVSDDEVPEISITGGPNVTEGDTVEFTLTASLAPYQPLSVGLIITHVGDFGVTAHVQNVSVDTSGAGRAAIATVDDKVNEPAGSVNARMQAGAGYKVSGSQDYATVKVRDNDSLTRLDLSFISSDSVLAEPYLKDAERYMIRWWVEGDRDNTLQHKPTERATWIDGLSPSTKYVVEAVPRLNGSWEPHRKSPNQKFTTTP